MLVFKIKKIFAVALLQIFPVMLFAQSKLDSLQHLDEVVITARPYKEVIPAQRLDGAQLKRLNTHSVADALRYFSGVQIKDYGGMGGLKTVDVRNMGSHHVGVFYDGIQIGNAQNSAVDLGRFSLDDLEELSMYNGQKSEIFQSAKDFASASAVYLKARKPRFEGDKKTNLLVRYKAGTIQLINPSFRLEQKINDRLNVSLSGEFLKSDGQYKFRYRRNNLDGTVAYDTTATRWNSDIEAFRAEAGIYGVIENGYWQAKVYYYDSDRGLPGAIVKNVWQSGERQADKNFFAQGTLVKEFTPRYKLQLNGKFAYDYTHYLSRDTVLFMEESVTKKMQYDNTYYQQDWYLSLTNMYAVSSIWDVSLSVDFQYNKLNATMRGVGTPFTFPQRYTTWIALATALNLGKVKMQADLLGTFAIEKVRNNVKSPDKSELSPAFFIGYQPFSRHDLNLRAFYKRIFRLPTFNDLYYTQIGYSQLKPEYTNQINVGATYAKRFKNSVIDQVSMQVDAYYAFITDKIIAAPTGSSFRWMMTNMGKVENKGIDVSASVSGHAGPVQLNSRLSYSYTKAQDFTKIGGHKLSSYGDQIPYTPWHSGSVIAGATYRSWALNYSFIYVGERYDGAVNNIAYNHVQPWYTHDASLQKEFRFGDIRFKASVEANNIFNQYYDVVLNYPMPGRNFRFVFTLNI
ncbi:TonB-dependent receptor [Bacteroides cellulosilyticus]|jgi:vitamin B12 transporter|uniref:TonB-dependent receptor n=1 Tax=Bacteroides cellulosilyticus TaxID=246787 RepID=UPI0018ACC9A8|nr:TonB-dependent receptor plug domain-containing protein [Bacteroides cellulosilyticus]